MVTSTKHPNGRYRLTVNSVYLQRQGHPVLPVPLLRAGCRRVLFLLQLLGEGILEGREGGREIRDHPPPEEQVDARNLSDFVIRISACEDDSNLSFIQVFIHGMVVN